MATLEFVTSEPNITPVLATKVAPVLIVMLVVLMAEFEIDNS